MSIDVPTSKESSNKIESFSQQVAVMHDRLFHLFNQLNHSPQMASNLMPSVLKELGIAMEELQVTVEELQQKEEDLSLALELANIERQRYQELFHFAPEAYLVTSLEGCIQEANRTAAQLLNVSTQFLIGKPLAVFVREDDRAAFRLELLRRQQRDYFQEWETSLQTRDGKLFNVACSTLAIRNQDHQPESFRWMIRDISERKRIAALEQSCHDDNNGHTQDLLHNRLRHFYSQGELIPLNPQTLWYVDHGLVKLTTLTDKNQDVLIGLVGSGMPFGAYLTALPLYEAIAVSDVQLVGFSVNEIFASHSLAQFFFAKTRQRLQQTETLLLIAGERQIESRLCRLLQLLKDEVGQPVPQGIRLGLRLTHEDFANACGATRVTISRLFSQLRQDGKIYFDEKKHIVIVDDLALVS
ncbi:PAS domain S-box protein [Pantanalinema sp. GBBB05]|uniref:PAS domain S-box protein n=1 Tax=Pantanalinema sp. GBBB05 TaxID=2604139 RepID=UPI001D612AEA|nr:PAS domain S-box protein [Pantanalinema sp. GBBB05]